ncbi:hypothetical protein Dtox_1838 [Desulfofarcimen acetoxidans DSM 771]|uniref:Uncharacterized protein n=1 Tax=Desulfofarcimen acetoxidans (strain ATCC 49208 / DSM 771 / KCTC 5769 / VKM B-1644 / 5575) TaxID=485916 RepID=C8VXN0_DESAS|nr:hypothetical protein Dtox_1838 [Desulfofarcimen acetoxidans DSM 771]
MSEHGELSITKWVNKLKHDSLLCAMIGVPPGMFLMLVNIMIL